LNINFTQTEYRLLLDVIFIADWVLTAHDPAGGSENDPHQMLFQKLYSHAKEMGCSDLVDEVTESNSYAPSRKYEDESGVFHWIEEYDDASFWEELIERLTERDVYARIPADQQDGLAAEEYWRRAAPYEQKYGQEFERHGLDRVVIKET
jgi:hypothetical protein